MLHSRRVGKLYGFITTGGLLAAAAALLAAAAPEPYEAGGKWGYRAEGGAPLLPPLFERAGAYSGGLAPVLLAGKWGYLDEAGRFSIAPLYTDARGFSAGEAEVRLGDGRWAVIDSSGTVLRYAAAAPPPGPEGLEPFSAGGLYGYRDRTGRVAIPTLYSAAGPFSEGLARVRDVKWGLIDRTGRFAARPVYDGLGDLREGLAAFSRGGRWGYLDRRGREAVAANYDEASDFSEGLAAVRVGARWGYIDKKGTFAFWPQFDGAGPFSGGLAAVTAALAAPPGAFPPVRLERRWIDRAGRVVYTGAGDGGGELEIVVSSSGLYGFAGDRRPPAPAFEGAYGCWRGSCLVKTGGRYAFADYAGTVTLRTDFEEVAPLGCGWYRYKQGLYGLLTSSGGAASPPLYSSISGSACAGLDAALDGAAGRLEPATAAFTPAEQPFRLSEKCLQAEPRLADMPYQAIPLYCGSAELREISQKRPDCLNCLLALAWIHTSTAAVRGQPDAGAADAALTAALQLYGGSPALYQWRAGVRLSSAPLAALAAEDYRQLALLEPGRPEHARALCAVHASAGPDAAGPAAALADCDRAVAAEPAHAQNYVSRASLKRRLGDGGGALGDLGEALRLAPADRQARLARARLSAELGQDFRAIYDSAKVLEAEPADADALEERAMACVRSGCCGRAISDLDAAARARPGPGNLQKRAVYYWACERDPARTAVAAEELRALGDACGGPCWPPAGYEKYLSGFSEPAAQFFTRSSQQFPAPPGAAAQPPVFPPPAIQPQAGQPPPPAAAEAPVSTKQPGAPAGPASEPLIVPPAQQPASPPAAAPPTPAAAQAAAEPPAAAPVKAPGKPYRPSSPPSWQAPAAEAVP